MNYKDTLDAFKASCRSYKNEKMNLERLRASKDADPMFYQLYSYVKEDVEFVEKTMAEIEKKCGTNARLIIYLLFVEERTQVAVADEFGITRRQIQYSIEKWMRATLSYEE